MLNFHKFLRTMYTYVLNSVLKISMMFAKYFEYYTIILKGAFFVDTQYTTGTRKVTRPKFLLQKIVPHYIC